MRFQIPLTQWDHPSRQPVEALAPAVAPVGHLGLRGGGKGSSPLVYIAAGSHEVGLWDVEEGKCHQVGTTTGNVIIFSHCNPLNVGHQFGSLP